MLRTGFRAEKGRGMSDKKQRRNVVVMTASLGILLVPVVMSVGKYVFAKAYRPTFLDRPVDTSKGCVEETEFMRFHHMDLLKDLRERSVREGQRSKVTFDTCKQCHPSRERFCNRCHEAASVSPDCFGCHEDGD